ncbi:protein of unknown function [Mucilaginibacter mallensis]|uniref:eCIS core domain-containing protein n=1 Tax=Mucilaginibacter mallensis TaxID=652787 RepID=A0A1H1XTX7_MUCMA|nr:DUF4157 domain-containing protein [Mucilaginibacter mallensis]SDT12329.1 protein of unknown function [Mucilaginibacter mallensis]
MGNEKTPGGKQASLAPASNNRTLNGVGYPAVALFTQAPVNNNSNSLPHQLRQGVEALSGISMAGTSVHYNSSAPAQIGALAYAAGNQIHLGPGQEQHLPHEAWHVVQQKQGRVKPTLQAKGLSLNDDPTLETEADIMGRQAAQLKTTEPVELATEPVPAATNVVQRKIGFEFQAVDSVVLINVKPGKHDLGVSKSKEFTVTSDGGKEADEPGKRILWPELELVTKPVEETPEGRERLVDMMEEIDEFSKSIKDGDYIAGTGGDIINWNGSAAKKSELDVVNAEVDEELKTGDTEEEPGHKSKLRETRRKEKLEEKKVPKYHIVEKVTFHPQATVGVKFENVIDLISYLTNAPIKEGGVVMGETKRVEGGDAITTGAGGTSQKETKDLKRDSHERIYSPQVAAKVIGWGSGGTPYGRYRYRPFKYSWMAALNKVNPELPAKVKALAAIFYGLAENRSAEYKKEIGNPHYVKDMMPFMLRTGFLPFFNNLNEDEKKELKKIDWKGALDVPIMPESKDEKRDFSEIEKIPTVMEIFAALIGTKETIQMEHKREVDVQIDLKGESVNVQVALHKGEEVKVLNEDAKDYLLDERVAGHGDIESLTDFEEDEEGVNDIGISETDVATTGPERRRGAIIELRNLGNKVPPEKLTAFATAVFDLITLVNWNPSFPRPLPVIPPPPPPDD